MKKQQVMDCIQKEGGVYCTLAQGEVAYTKEKHGEVLGIEMI